MPRTPDRWRFLCALSVGALGCSGGNRSLGFASDGGDGPWTNADASALANPASLAIRPKSAQVVLVASGAGFSATSAFTAQATFADGSSRDVSASAQWVSTDATMVSVTNGVATARAPGVYTIRATEGSASDDATLTVTLSGAMYAAGFAAADQRKLDAAPTGGATTSIAYPLASALLPANLAPVTVHIAKSVPSQSRARLSFDAAPLLALDYYAPCEAGPNSQAACYVTLPAALTSLFAPASAAADITLRGRVAASDGSALAETAPIRVAWAPVNLTGGLYYWTTIPAVQNDGSTGICRYDFDGDHSMPQTVYTDKGSPPDHVNGVTCVGCHAISHDGTKMAMTIGGSVPSDWMLLDVATKNRIALRDQAPFATETVFNPDGSRMVNMLRGDLTLRAADATLAAEGTVLASIPEKKTDAFWSNDGTLLAFVGWLPGQNGALPASDSNGLNGDTKPGGQIWLAPSDGLTVASSAKVLVGRAVGRTSFYPAISDDSRLVVFDQSSCSGPPTAGYGGGPCDGYDDVSARLYAVTPGGGTPVALDHANGPPNSSNSWPRWSPDHGTFRGKTLYWIAFSSRRPYGLALDVAGDATGKPQLWFAAIALDSGGLTADPSFAPVWLPGQDPDLAAPNGNHVPQWVTKAVPIAQ